MADDDLDLDEVFNEDQDEDENLDPSTDEEKTEARRQGWVPESEWRGDPPPGGFKTAQEFLAISDDNPKVQRERLRKMNTDMEDMKAQLVKADENIATLVRVSKHQSAANKAIAKRAYDEGRRDAEEARRQAIEDGDHAAVDRADKQLRDLDELKEASEADDEPVSPPPPPPPSATQKDPRVQAWYESSDWFDRPGHEVESALMVKECDRLKAEKGTDLYGVIHEAEQNVMAKMRRMNGDGDVGDGDDDDKRRENPRRRARSVSPSTPGERRGSKPTMRNVPPDERANFEKDRAFMKEKGIDYTEEEFLSKYFQE